MRSFFLGIIVFSMAAATTIHLLISVVIGDCFNLSFRQNPVQVMTQKPVLTSSFLDGKNLIKKPASRYASSNLIILKQSCNWGFRGTRSSSDIPLGPKGLKAWIQNDVWCTEELAGWTSRGTRFSGVQEARAFQGSSRAELSELTFRRILSWSIQPKTKIDFSLKG